MRQVTSQPSLMEATIESLNETVLQKYGRVGADILNTYNSDFLFRKELTERECIEGSYPTIAQLNSQFDKRFGPAWLMAHLHDLSEYCGCKEKLSGHALQQCAAMISMEYYYLKVTEFMLFFHRFKAGRYGRFYGSVDPLVITTALMDFVKERNIACNRYDEERKKAEEEEAKKSAVSWEEFCKETGRDEKSPLMRSKRKAPATTKPKREKRNTEDYAKSSAVSLINNTYHCDENTLKMMKDMFEQKYGCTPEEYVSQKH